MPAPTPARFKATLVVEALQWDGSEAAADALWEWTKFVVSRRADGSPNAVATDFMVLGEDDAYEVFCCYDEDFELRPGNEVERRMSAGYTAVIRDRLCGAWANVRTGDWIIRGAAGPFQVCRDGDFSGKYRSVTGDRHDCP
ncbi:hypothetical protein [Gordonia sihwensis]|uniref:hypothetical protein n=1 Tax=Gordonia sihwensis TaxID=173559 RepID=UPI0005EE7DAB|nr:hypothetical protein [Gordonia sihwensis]KJR10270.1 hypothetical protein UG54_01440 [Gordonia sihwensis]